MQRLTSGGYNAPGLVDRDQAARAAAIASMGLRLAAAGPRTRQRRVDREVFQDPAQEARQTEAPREAASATILQLPDHQQTPYVPFHEPTFGLECGAQPGSAAAIRLFTALGTAAACGFGLVLLLQNPHWISAHHGSFGAATTRPSVVQVAQIPAAPVKADLPATVPVKVVQPHPLEQDATAAVPPSQAAPESIADEPASEPGKRSADPVPTVQPAPHTARTKTSAAPETPAPVRPKAEAEYASVSRVHTRPVLAPRQMEVKAHPGVVAKYDFPRWLTDDHPPEEHPHRAHVLVMSEPPHDLMPPSGATAAPVQVASAPTHPAPRMQAIIFARAPTQVALRPPGYRPFAGTPYPTFYGPYYPPAAESPGRTDVAGETQERQYRAAPSNGW